MIPFLFPFSRGLLFPLVALDKIYDRELNLMSKYRQMNKLYSENIKIRGKYGKKLEYYKLKSPKRGKVYTKSCIRRHSTNTVKFTKLKHFLSIS